ncbi:MAG TPA: DUF3108 domain-containing protein [Candidatus Limnocylindrales bacterium]|nr:DUF3108 domain-containing protein [Candidatus Limnocylindrales bacterium]
MPQARFAGPTSFLLVTILLIFTIGLAHSRPLSSATPQTTSHKSSRNKPASPPKDLPVPFRVGEILKYQVSWASFTTAASVELTVPERGDLFGWPTWHFRAAAHTLSPVRSLFAIDDQFDSYTDAATGESRQYETHLSEMGRKLDQIWRFVVQGQTPRAPGNAVIVLPGTRDPLGALYALRAADWQRTPEVRMPVYDGHDLYDLRAQIEASNESVQVPAGKFTASRIALQIFEGGKEVSGIGFAAWIANDAARTPVLMTAELPFGSLRVEMISANQ